jgi:hypothetical protein
VSSQVTGVGLCILILGKFHIQCRKGEESHKREESQKASVHCGVSDACNG